jgi:hypothetical protein
VFQITLVDHVRLSFGTALAAYEGHAEAAATLARRSSYARIALLVLAGTAATLSAIGVQGGYALHLGTAILAAATFGACAAYIGWNQQPLIYGHRVSAAKMWVICESYRALLAEMHEDLIDLPTLQQRRNALLNESAAVMAQAAPDDRYTFEIAREALSGPQAAGYPDSLIDRYLPPPLRKEASASGPS